MMSADGGIVIAINDEIYKGNELRRELQERGHKFRSSCDTEVLLEAFAAATA